MRHDDRVYAGQMFDLARKIAERVARASRDDFDADEDLRLALAHLIQTLGEAARRISPELTSRHTTIPWSAIVGMRHKIVHDYLSVDFDLVWEVATLEIPALIEQLTPLVDTKSEPS